MFSTVFNRWHNYNDSNYNFLIDKKLLESSSAKEIIETENNLGNKIKPKQDLTSKQLSDAAWVNLTVGAFYLNFPLFAIASGLVGIVNYLREDYDSPENRSKLMKKIANESFENIAKFHSTENIIGYQLLDEIPVVQAADPTQRVVFYTYFQQLAKEFNRLNKWRNREKNEIQQKWTKVTNEVSDDAKGIFFELTVVYPWNKWKKIELGKIDKVYRDNIDILNDSFRDKFHS